MEMSLHETSGIMYAFWSRTGGRAADEFSDDDLRTLGSLLARIHNMGDMERAEHRMALTGESYGLEPLAYLTDMGFLPERCRERYSRAAKEIAGIYESMRPENPFSAYTATAIRQSSS
jgi:Ser/Thr protein kinase RdoA (MazF antagonist)